MSGYVELCHCGHDKSTHFEKTHTCLGMRCDCTAYLDRDRPKPAPPPPPKPAPHVDDGWDDVSPITHPSGCVCIVCYVGRMYP
jgi:hypothetical protein